MNNTKKVTVEIPKFTKESGFNFDWKGDFKIFVKNENDEISIQANKDGLISLAGHLLNLAQEDVPTPYHLHFDDMNSLEEGSLALIIEKKNN